MKDSGSGGSLTIDVWEIVQYYYCPRKIYYLRTLGTPVPKRRKMTAGTDEHTREIKRSKERRSVFGFPTEEVEDVHYRQPMEDDHIGLAGQVDAVVRLKSGAIIPVEIKYSDYPVAFRGRRKQLIAYALLAESKFKARVDRGLLYFPAQNQQVLVPITAEDKRSLIEDLERIRRLILDEKVPQRGPRMKCGYCEVARFCTA